MECLSKQIEYLWYSIFCYMSIASGVFVILLSIMPGVMEPLSRRIIISISMNNILNNIFFLLSIHSGGSFCLFISYYKSTLLLIGVVWLVLISKIIHDTIVKKASIHPRAFLLCSAFCYIITPILFLLPFSTGSYVDTKNDCSGFKVDVFGIMWRFIILYIPCLLIISAAIFYYVRIYRYLKSSDSFSKLGLLINRGMAYSLFFLVIVVLLIIARILQLFSNNCYSRGFVFTAVSLIYLQGFFMLVITLARGDVRSAVRNMIKPRERLESEGDYIEEILYSSPNV